MLTSTPSDVQLARMQPLARLPVFLSLEGRRVVVAGHTAAAAWKAELLSAAGAQVEVYAAEPCEELLALAPDPPHGSIFIHRRAWYVDDLPGAAIAVGACDSEDEALHFAAAARAAGVPVNVIDKPKFCDFSFGAIVNRSPLVIGISTDGAAPVFAQAIRAKLEALIPRGFARWAEAARQWRRSVQISGLSFEARRQFWRAFTAFAMRHPDRTPEQADYDRLFEETAAEKPSSEPGSVMVIEIGSDDPELLTLRALRALQAADIILFDERVSPEVLEFARREARKMLVGSDQASLATGLAQAGRRVVRLVSSDATASGNNGTETRQLALRASSP
jgi:uroporphyrin-III C-methyltransferase/precorrin-2 dehydrogenase/sirohydrochlorin ferrochelatase